MDKESSEAQFVRIAVVSDTHLQHLKYNICMPEADMVIHAGDATFLGKIEELHLFFEWFKGLPYKYKILVAGNHDLMFERNRTLAASMLGRDVIYLEDKLVEIEGLKIYGSPWQPEYGKLAFNLPRGHRLREKWNKIPNGIDILVTHGPPMGIRDLNSDGLHVGCEDLRDVVTKRVKPRLHAFGHIHLSYGTTVIGRTLFANAAISGTDHKPDHRPIVVELDGKNRDLPPVLVQDAAIQPLDPIPER